MKYSFLSAFALCLFTCCVHMACGPVKNSQPTDGCYTYYHNKDQYEYLCNDNNWEVSGSAEIFKFIIKDITLEPGKGYYESGDFNKLSAIGGVLVYHSEVIAVILVKKDSEK